MSARDTVREIMIITTDLISYGLSAQQNFPSIVESKGKTIVTWEDQKDISIALKDVKYGEMYSEMEKSRSYNFKMIDGALIQLMYTFNRGELETHRLAFFPSPDLEEYQNEPELYEADEIYADIISKQIVTFPIRFDYSVDDSLHIEVDHPKSHVTLGQYKNCRIPVFSPLSPFVFMDFILRNFYSTAFKKYYMEPKKSILSFERSITKGEEGVFHLNIV